MSWGWAVCLVAALQGGRGKSLLPTPAFANSADSDAPCYSVQYSDKANTVLVLQLISQSGPKRPETQQALFSQYDP